MSKLILTSKELKSWKIESGQPVLHICLKRSYESKQIQRFGFESTIKGTLISIYNLTPIIGFFATRKIREFRSSLREGLFISYQRKRNDVEIILEKLDGKERLIELKRIQ